MKGWRQIENLTGRLERRDDFPYVFRQASSQLFETWWGLDAGRSRAFGLQRVDTLVGYDTHYHTRLMDGGNGRRSGESAAIFVLLFLIGDDFSLFSSA